jgi:hypothetical protein
LIESLLEIINDNGVIGANFATPQNTIIRNTNFPHHNVHKCACVYIGNKEIDHINMGRYSNAFHILSFNRTNSDTDQYLSVGNSRKG